MSAIKSQLAALSGTVPSAAPQSTLARHIAADLKGGETKHNYTMSVIAAAILQAYKGNLRDIPEAVKLCAGKSVKARAYLAGFQAVQESVRPVSYKGKLDSAENADVRDRIEGLARAAEFDFEAAYLAVFVNAKIESAANRKAKTVPVVAESVAPVAQAESDDSAVDAGESVTVDIGTAVDAVADAIRFGMLNADELTLIRAALAMIDAPVNGYLPANSSAEAYDTAH